MKSAWDTYNREPFRCAACGRFLDPSRPDVTSEYTPDTAFTHESTEFYHRSCLSALEAGEEE